MKTGQKGQPGSTKSRSRKELPRLEKPARRPQATMATPGVEIIAGRNAVREALRAGRRVRRLLYVDDMPRDPAVEDAVRIAWESRTPMEAARRDKLDSMALDHQGLVAFVAPYHYASWGDVLEGIRGAERPPTVLLLDTLHDPQNFGTLLRAADALRVDAVVLPKHRSVQVTPAVVRSSAGAVEHLRVATVPNLGRAVEDLKESGLWVVGLDMEGDREYWDLDMSGPTALVLGGEDHGIGRLLKEKCDFLVRLPMFGHVTSLNAAVAGAVVLYEMVRQRTIKVALEARPEPE